MAGKLYSILEFNDLPGSLLVSNSVRFIVTVCVGAVIFAGLPLFGWGLDDTAGFFANPARLAFVLLVILLNIIVAIRFPRAPQNRGEGEATVQRQQLAVVLLQVLSIAVVVVAPFTDRRNIVVLTVLDVTRYIGLVLFALGFIVINWAEYVLGRQFSVQVTIQKDHQLITQGPYRMVRHPRYLGIIIFSLGVALVFQSAITLALVVALLLVLLWRIRDEEALLSQTFGKEWDAYSAKSWHLIPYIY